MFAKEMHVILQNMFLFNSHNITIYNNSPFPQPSPSPPLTIVYQTSMVTTNQADTLTFSFENDLISQL